MLQQRRLDRQSSALDVAGIAARPARADNAMIGYHDGDRILPACVADRASAGGKPRRQCAVG